MNLRFRTRQKALIARPAPVSDALSGVREAFSSQKTCVQAFISPDGGRLSTTPPGLTARETRWMILPPGANIRARDGVWLEDRGALPAWRCVRVERYPLHTRALLERREGA